MNVALQQQLIQDGVRAALGDLYLQLIASQATVKALETEVQTLKDKLVKAKLGSEPEGESS